MKKKHIKKWKNQHWTFGTFWDSKSSIFKKHVFFWTFWVPKSLKSSFFLVKKTKKQKNELFELFYIYIYIIIKAKKLKSSKKNNFWFLLFFHQNFELFGSQKVPKQFIFWHVVWCPKSLKRSVLKFYPKNKFKKMKNHEWQKDSRLVVPAIAWKFVFLYIFGVAFWTKVPVMAWGFQTLIFLHGCKPKKKVPVMAWGF